MLIFASILSLNVFATDDEFIYGKESYAEYNITLEYPGYFTDNITLYVFNNGAPDWNSEIVMGTQEVEYSISDRGYIEFVFYNPEHCFAGKKFVLYLEDVLVNKFDIIQDNFNYYVELIDSGNSFSIKSNYVTYYYDMPFAELSWTEYIFELGYPENELFFVYNDYVFFNGYALKTIEGQFVLASDTVNMIQYYQSTNYHGHDWVNTRTVIQAPNCLRPAIMLQECSVCKKTREYIDYSFVGTDHSYSEYTGISPTCLEFGYREAQCDLCGQKYYEVFEPLGHRFRSATCTEPGKCIRSGCEATVEALGHDLNVLGKCQRGGCDYNKVAGWWKGNIAETTNDVVEQAKKDVEDAIEIVNDTLSNIGDGAKNFWENIVQSGNNIKEFFSSLFSISAFITIVLLLIIGLNYGLGFYNSINTFKDIRRRKKRRKKNKNKKKEIKK